MASELSGRHDGAMDNQRLQSLFGLDGKRAVVTGGSRGIGLMIAEGLIDAGCEVIISARKAEQVADAAARLSEKGTCIGVPADLSTDEGIAHLGEVVAERWNSLDILCNNAGASWGEPIESFSPGGWDKVMNVNVRSVFFLTQELLPLLRAGASSESPSRVINTGSVNGLTPPEWDTFSYSTSKAAVHMLTKHLAKNLAKDHITVNAIAPGPFDSNMMSFALNDPASRASIANDVPMGRVGVPGDMAGVAIYLSSAAGSYVTGSVIPVGGGLSTIHK
jgi:NAD(P)-dependent dehydrogenase (short-subunit alcohol dehydrogenase family)